MFFVTDTGRLQATRTSRNHYDKKAAGALARVDFQTGGHPRHHQAGCGCARWWRPMARVQSRGGRCASNGGRPAGGAGRPQLGRAEAQVRAEGRTERGGALRGHGALQACRSTRQLKAGR